MSGEKKFILLLIGLHLVITLPFAYFLNVWADEASTLATTENFFWRRCQFITKNKPRFIFC